MKVLFFEDEFSDEENVAFINRLYILIPNIQLVKAGSFEVFDKLARREKFDAFILDIMGAENSIIEFNTGKKVNSHYIGLEMLNRIRNSYYPLQDKNSIVIMRTARANELKIQRDCKKLGTSYIFKPAKNGDKEIIKILQDNFS